MAFFGAIPATVIAVATLFKSQQTVKKIEELHVVVNDSLSQLIEATKKIADSEGYARGVKAQNDHSVSPYDKD